MQIEKVSIIVATINRTFLLQRLFESIVNGTYKNIEVILVDQNIDGFLDDIIELYKLRINIKHIRSTIKGVSINKNIGFRYSSGDILNFSDDDSFFETNTIELGVELLKNWDAVSGKVICPIVGKSSLLKFPEEGTEVSALNFYYTTIEFSMFWKKSIFVEIGEWDELLGVGGVWGSEGGADLLVRSLKKNARIYYYPNLIFYHENQIKKDSKKLYSYGRGHGALIAKNLLFERNFRVIPYSFFYFFGALIKSFILNKNQRNTYKNRIKGIIQGFQEYLIYKKNETNKT